MNRFHSLRTLLCAAAAVLPLAALSGCERRAAEPSAPASTGSGSQPPASPAPDMAPPAASAAPTLPPASAASQ